jgi:hypothetical protein
MRYYWRNIVGGAKLPAVPLVRGTLGHVMLAHYYARKVAVERGVPPDRFYSPSDAATIIAGRHGEVGENLLPTVLYAFEAYRRAYVIETFEVIGIESLLETIFHGYRYTARADLIVRMNGSQKVWIYDHKFVGRIEDRTFQRYAISGQFLGLQHLGRARYGADFGGVIVNAVDCTTGACERRQPAVSPWALTRFPEVVRAAEEGIARMEATREPPAHMALSELACFTPYGRCDFYDRCRWGTAV